jgi:hypothetical protein
VLYCPDSFGHPAALPALAAGFGLPAVVAWRGYGGARGPAGDAVWWRAADGARALLLHLPPDGYEFGSRLPPALPSARERWAAMRAVLAPRARLGVALVMNGADHHALQERWAEAVDALARAAAPEPVRAASLGEAVGLAAARALAREGTPDALPEVAGELRDSYGYAWTLQGTFASRAARSAGRRARPGAWCATWSPGSRSPRSAGRARAGAAERRLALLRAAWRPLLECLPHDTLCGCSTDAVARAADARLEDCAAQGRGLRADALAALVGHDADAARRWRDGWRAAAVVRNRAARPRGGVAEVELLTFVRDVPVGPGSAGAWRDATGSVVRGVPVTLEGDDGPLAVQVLDRHGPPRPRRGAAALPGRRPRRGGAGAWRGCRRSTGTRCARSRSSRRPPTTRPARALGAGPRAAGAGGARARARGSATVASPSRSTPAARCASRRAAWWCRRCSHSRTWATPATSTRRRRSAGPSRPRGATASRWCTTGRSARRCACVPDARAGGARREEGGAFARPTRARGGPRSCRSR